MERAARDKVQELAHLIVHGTERDRDKLVSLTEWFDQYLADATPLEAMELRAAARRLRPLGVRVLMDLAEAGNVHARQDLERMGSLREGGRN